MGFELCGRRLTAGQRAWVLAHEANAIEMLQHDSDADGNPVLDDPTMLDLDKIWACLNFLLTDSNERRFDGVGAALFGGRDLGGETTWGDHPRLMEADEVRVVHRRLEAVSVEELTARFDPVRLRKLSIYPAGARWDEGYLGWALDRFEHLVAFYADAARAGQSILLSLT